MIIVYKPGDKVRTLKPIRTGWMGQGIVLQASARLVKIVIMEGPNLGSSAIFLPQELKPVKD